MNHNPGQRKVFWLLGLILVVAAAVATYYFYYQSRAGSDETEQLLARVSELIVLPAEEQPTIATVTDPEALKGQPFFARAKNGDKVLIYSKAQKAILYDPVKNLILEVAPINLNMDSAATRE
ncbi:MAG: hypothetical protein AAB505_01975 [Patescibacteria group bacterium]